MEKMRKHKPVRKRRDDEPTDTIAAFKAMRELEQKEAEQRRNESEAELHDAIASLGLPAAQRLTDYQFRIDHNGVKVDIYPTNRKYHNVTINHRGRIRRTIAEFLKLEYSL